MEYRTPLTRLVSPRGPKLRPPPRASFRFQLTDSSVERCERVVDSAYPLLTDMTGLDGCEAGACACSGTPESASGAALPPLAGRGSAYMLRIDFGIRCAFIKGMVPEGEVRDVTPQLDPFAAAAFIRFWLSKCVFFF